MKRAGQFLIAMFFSWLFPHMAASQDNKSSSSHAGTCDIPSSSAELNINNVRALILSGGDMWWNLKDKAMYEVPAGSGKTALFAGAVWMGGLDANEQLHLCAVRYRASGSNYRTGPLINLGPDQGTTSGDVCMKYDKVFNINREDVRTFIDWYNTSEEVKQLKYPGYIIPEEIINWPGNGDVAAGYDQFIAPFYDNDGDGIYNALKGDYPYYDFENEMSCKTSRGNHKIVLLGDQTLWWVFNDNGDIHADPPGDAMKVEIRAQAFAYAGSSTLNNCTFYQYQLINRSYNTYSSTYLALWTDADMGYAWDDYIGCDVNRGLGYLYNGDAIDGSGESYAYGGPTPPPPAIGIDFLAGPYQDADLQDNSSSRDTTTGYLSCDGNIMNGNINGLGFGDGIVDNERWGMTHYIAFNGSSGVQGDPNTATEFYNYIRGKWKDGTNLFYDGTGHYSDPGTSNTPSAFMYPGDSDPCGWGTGSNPQIPWDEFSEDNYPDDRRFVISTGPFTFEPGEVNDAILGVVWSQAMAGDNWSSVEALKNDDDKVQRLFDHCMRSIDGPNAPELKIIELSKELVFQVFNLPVSNNYLEKYYEQDYSISDVDTDFNGTLDPVDKHFRFEGYQIFQLIDSTIGFDDLWNPDFARLAYQCDIKNGVDKVVNYEWSAELKTIVPVVKVEGTNNGIGHSFSLKTDMFSSNGKLANYKKYYYMPIAYAYNNYQAYDFLNPMAYQAQKTPYLAGTLSAGGHLKVFTAMPHSYGSQNPPADYGNEPEIAQVHGMSGVRNILELTDLTINDIMASPPWQAEVPVYKRGCGPVKVKVIDPLNLPEGDFVIKFDSVQYHKFNFSISDAKFYMVKYPVSDEIELEQYSGFSNGNSPGLINHQKNNEGYQSTGDTVWSENWISTCTEEIIPQWGISVKIEVVQYPFYQTNDSLGFLSASIEYSDTINQWLTFLQDVDAFNALNWIRAGTQYVESNLNYNDYDLYYTEYDEDEVYESVLSGTIAPYKLVSHFEDGPAYDTLGCHRKIDIKFQHLASVDLVITSDKSKWTRCCVIETSENDTDNTGKPIPGMNVTGEAYKFDLRRSPSVDKEGNPAVPGSGYSENQNSPNYISDNGMGWFPGYAINVETGERLNIMFGEASELPAYNGRDMQFNPTADIFSKLDETLFGGKHYVYIMGHNMEPKDSLSKEFPYMPLYDAGRYIYDKLSRFDMSGTSSVKQFKQSIYRNAMWVCIPLLNPAFSGTDFNDALNKSEVKIQIRISNPVSNSVSTDNYYDTMNIATGDTTFLYFPQYWFSTKGLAYQQSESDKLFSILDSVHIVPNPYYCFSEYETGETDNIVKIINLPAKCTISVYNINGKLITRIRKENPLGYQDWDLRNNQGRKIAGGVYIVHIKADGIGEKVIKWAGAIRE